MPVSHDQLNALLGSVLGAFTNVQNNALKAVLSQQMPLVGGAFAITGADGTKGFANLGQKLREAFDPLVKSNGPATETEVANKIEQALGGGVNATVTVNGSDVLVELTHNKSYSPFTVSIDEKAGLEGLNLEFKAAGTVTSAFDYGFDIAFGVDGAGFYIKPDTAADAHELQLGISATTPGLSLATKLGFLLFEAANHNNETGLFGTFTLDLVDPNGDGKLRTNELSGNFFTAEFDGHANLHLDLESATESSGFLPKVTTGLRVDWPIAHAAVSPGGTTTTFGQQPTVRLEDLSIDTGTFFSAFAEPVLSVVKPIIAPVSDVVSLLTTPIEMLQQIGFSNAIGIPNASLLDLAQGFGLVNPAVASAIRAVGGILESIAGLPEDPESIIFNLGDHTFGPTVDFRRAEEWLEAEIPNATDAEAMPQQLANFLNKSHDYTQSVLKFPITEDPAQLVKLLIGQEKGAQLFTYDLITVPQESAGNADSPIKIPIYPPVFAEFGLDMTFGVNLGLGFDTYGLKKWADGGFKDASLIFDGFYLRDFDNSESFDAKEFVLGLTATAHAALDLFFAKATVGAYFKSDLSLDLNLPNIDGDAARVHYNEIVAAKQNPYGLFNAKGNLTAGFSGSFEIKNTVFFNTHQKFGASFKLFDFAEAQAKAGKLELPQPVTLGSYRFFAEVDEALVHVGLNAGKRHSKFNNKDVAENFNILPGTLQHSVVVNSPLGPDTIVYGISRIYAHAGNGDDRITLAQEITLPARIFGGAGDDTLQGGSGDDLISGNDGLAYEKKGTEHDRLFGGAGNDRLFAGSFSAGSLLDGGSGDDELVGEHGDDTLVGGTGADRMDGGFGGNDIYYVDNPGDKIYEANGTSIDTVITSLTHTDLQLIALGPFGAATIEDLVLEGGAISGFGSVAKNRIYGNTANNLLFGFAGDDYISGKDGDDEIRGDSGQAGSADDPGDGSDFLSGDDGDDTLLGNGGPDVLHGGTGNDHLDGGSHIDDLYGESGEDTLDGGSGIDSMTGGPGDDLYYVDISADKIFEYKNAKSPSGLIVMGGTDLVIATANYKLSDSEKSGWIENLKLDVGPDGQPDDLTGTGNRRNNIITGNDGNNVLSGLKGDDWLKGGIGSDVLFGGSEKDLLEGGDDDDELYGDGGKDTLRGGNGADMLFGGLGDDVLEGDGAGTNAPGNDLLDGGAGSDVLRGGIGDDVYVVGFSKHVAMGPDQLIELPGEGDDLVDTRNPVFTLPANFESMIFTGKGSALLTGNSGPNSLVGGDGNDTLNGAGGADVLAGQKGGDLYFIDSVDDTVLEGPSGGIDKVIVTFTNYMMPTFVENLKLGGSAITAFGNELANKIEGNALGNIIDGGGGKDHLIGGEGDDFLNLAGKGTLDGGPDNDSYFVDTPTGVIIKDVSGIDIVFSTAVFFNLPAKVENLTLGDSDDINGSGNSGPNRITGNPGKNALTGYGDKDVLLGESGDDTLNGGSGPDQLYGGLGIDTLIGGVGEDLLFGYDLNGTPTGDLAASASAQSDTLKGGPNADIYYIDALDVVVELANEGVDTVVTRFSVSLETVGHVENIVLDGLDPIIGTGNNLANRIEGNSAGNILIGAAGKDVLLGAGGDDILIGGLDSDMLFGWSGEDDMDGGAGNDTMTGGEDNDRYRVDSAQDKIVEAVNGGVDEVLATVSYSLPANVENLKLLGTTETQGTGNDIANIITGNSGNDSMKGMGGDDILIGNDGHDVLDGGVGADTMLGGLGDDSYRVDNVSDIVDESDRANSGGTDSVQSTIDFMLPTGIEKLSLLTGAFLGSGNSIANIIVGNARDNVLKGALGGDTIIGGDGDDDIYGSGLGHSGLGEKDVVTGGPGSDRFFLFDGSPGPHYHDADPASPGMGDYLRVTDFKPGEGDRIQYASNSLLLAPTVVDGFSGLGLWMDKNGNATVDFTGPAPDELLALLEGFAPATLPAPGDIIDFYAF